MSAFNISVKQQNIVVNDRALPSIIDTDSFQVRNPVNGKIYRCPAYVLHLKI
ncbi:hypothetical protein GNF10_22505 [Nostoc sp. UCD121]|uniref:hypothetical protein n=1 Tax=unclassified Nostoc TaxID=2593658 RepID=UPI00162A9318|nr:MULTISPECIES: hypothetical protein [unclassified Nostoc]MBC1223792.1 hypothetical protein [Nostoc sp. UCD120]MBC1278659.1 hypothetical protein [Nostoc sp. UCD121]MBC1295841.1 hypothetical protein [Nostoc sp. UCD122]